MDELRIGAYTARIKGSCKACKLPVIDMGYAEIDCTALKMQTVTCHSPSSMPQIFIILVRAVSRYNMNLSPFADVVLDVTEQIDNFGIDRLYLIGIMTPHQIVDLIHGITVVAARRIIFYIESFAGMNVV